MITTVNPNLSPPFLMFANTIAFIPILKTTSSWPQYTIFFLPRILYSQTLSSFTSSSLFSFNTKYGLFKIAILGQRDSSASKDTC